MAEVNWKSVVLLAAAGGAAYLGYRMLTQAGLPEFAVQEFNISQYRSIAPDGTIFRRSPSEGPLLPIADGWAFEADGVFQHRGPADDLTIDLGLHVGDEWQVSRIYVHVGEDRKWKSYTVHFHKDNFDSRGLEPTRRIDVDRTLYDSAGNAHISARDTEPYFIIPDPEVDTNSLITRQYWSSRASGPEGSRVPIAPGDDFGVEIEFRYRNKGSNWTVIMELNVEGYSEWSFVDFSLPPTTDWKTAVVTTATGYLPKFDPHGLEVCRLIDTFNNLIHRGSNWELWDTVIRHEEINSFHRVA